MRFNDATTRPFCCWNNPFFAAVLMACLLITTAPIVARADALTVTSLADNGGTGELRAAITSANASPDSTITFESGLSGAITLTSALPPITTGVTIQGPGASKIAVDGDGKYRPFTIDSPGDAVAISGLTIQHGSDAADGDGGAGLTVTAGNVTLTSCVVYANISSGSGGGVRSAGNITFTSCSISSNTSNDNGGGVYSTGESIYSGCMVSGNICGSAKSGGGIYASGSVTLTNSLVSGNSGSKGDGGGIYVGADATITNSTLSGNSSGYGGGIYKDGATLTLTCCTLSANVANNGDGGGIYEWDSTVKLTNCTLSLNSSTGDGGGIAGGYATTEMMNCTLTGNGADSGGGGIQSPGTTTLTNCILFNDAPAGGEVAGSGVTATYCDVEGGLAGTGNINGNPLFVGPPTNLHLQSASPCYMAGTAAGAPGTTEDGYPRPNPPSMGAYELEEGTAPPPAPTYVVTSLADNGGAGELRAAIAAANANPAATITFKSGLTGTITLTSALPPITTTMTIVGPGASVVAVDGEGTYRPFTINSDGAQVTLSGLTIEHGSDAADGDGGAGLYVATGNVTLTACTVYANISTGSGGGVYNDAGNITFASCTIFSNTSSDNGGGVYSAGVSTFSDCTLSGNVSGSGKNGGGIYASGNLTLTFSTLSENSSDSNGEGGGIYDGADATITNSTLSGNSSGYGGGIYKNGATMTLTSCTLTDNVANNGDGGGIYEWDSTVKLTNCTLSLNSSTGSGGGIAGGYATTEMMNCTLTGNGAGSSGGGIQSPGTTTLTNCILYNDSPAGSEVAGSGVTATYSDVDGGLTGTGNIDANPLFVDAPSNLHLEPDSPCYKAGTAAGAPGTTEDGYPRPDPPSMGAYELEPGPVLPPAPTGLTATARNAEVALSWTASSGATSYSVYRSTTSGDEGTTPVGAGITTTAFTNTGLTDGITYYFKVAAVDAAGTSAQSNEVHATPVLPVPGAPTGLTATAGDATVVLKWTASSTAASYDVYRSTTSGDEGATPYKTTVTATSYTNTGLTNNVTYYYKVAAVNAGGTSTLSAEVSATPKASAPTVPTGLTATAGDKRVTLTWASSAGATGYNVYQAVGAGAFALVDTSSTPTYTPTGLTNGVVYSYTTEALNAAGTSARSPSVGVTPIGVQITSGPSYSIAGTTATVTWTTNIAAQSAVNYGATTALGKSVSSTTLTTSHSVTVAGLTAGQTCYFEVSSTDSTTTATSAIGQMAP